MRSPGPFRQLGVRDGLPEGNHGNLPPDLLLKVCSGTVEQKGELCSRAIKILLQLPASPAQNGMPRIMRPVILQRRRVLAVQVVNAGQLCSVGDQQQVAQQ